MISLQNNLMAPSAARALNSHYERLAVSTRNLSSGLRINSAADDAAGLAIREFMRADIASMRQGSRNANDAVSMLQVADGALAIIDEKLIRMKELAEQAATGTYDSTQRLMIESEYQAMADEIDRIANATDFNGLKLLDGSLRGPHNGSGLASTGAMKIHFGSGNDSAEDYYYIEIGNCTAAALGVGKRSLWQEPFLMYSYEEEHKTFTPQAAYKQYADPDTGLKYYSDGKYFFSDLSKPAETALDWVTDRHILEKLQTEQVSEKSKVTYLSYIDQDSGKTYWSHNRISFTTMPGDPNAPTISLKNPLYEGKSATVDTTWLLWQDEEEKIWYTSDGGLTFVPDKNEPEKNILNSAKAEDMDKIAAFEPKLQEVTNTKTEVVSYERFWIRGQNPIYYKSDAGYCSNPRDPAASKLNDADIIARLEPYPLAVNGGRRFEKWNDPFTNIAYYKSDENYYRSTSAGVAPISDQGVINRLTPVEEVVSYKQSYPLYMVHGSNQEYYSLDGGKSFFTLEKDTNKQVPVTAPAGIQPVPRTTPGMKTFSVYVEKDNPDKVWYSADDGKTFMEDYLHPSDGLHLGENDPASANLIKANRSVSVQETYEIYKDGGNPPTLYYTADGGITFVENPQKGETVKFSKNDSATAAMAAKLVPDIRAREASVQYYHYKNDAGTSFYTLKEGDKSVYISSLANPEAAPVLKQPADAAKIAALSPVPASENELYLYYEYRYTDPATQQQKNYYTPLYGNFTAYYEDANRPESPATIYPELLVPVPGSSYVVSLEIKLPASYELYEDIETGLIYYSSDGGQTFTTDPFDPRKTLNPQNADDQKILTNLKPQRAVVRKEQWIERGGHTISTQEAAQKALIGINDAIVSKDKIRAHLGALQNRLENTITNLNIQAENLQASESRISDVDVATEMTQFVRNQILSQSSSAMLTQANSMPQMIMSLIQG